MTSKDEAIVIQSYNAAYNAITQPSNLVTCSHYFVSRWMPLLGAEATRIVLSLRSLGYFDPKSGEKREGIPITLEELSAMCGCSIATIKREFGPYVPKKGEKKEDFEGVLQNPVLHKFVSKQKQYRRCRTTGRILHTENVFNVKMDDPIHDDDLPRLQQLLDDMNKAAKPPAEPKAQIKLTGNLPSAQIKPTVPAPKAQNKPSGAHFELPAAQNESKSNQNEPTLESSSSSLNTFATLESSSSSLNTFATLGDSILSSPDEIQEIRPWATLSDIKRDPWRKQAIHEIGHENMPKTDRGGMMQKAIDKRARTLYEKAAKESGGVWQSN